MPIIGTTPDSIDLRRRPRALPADAARRSKLRQPPNRTARSAAKRDRRGRRRSAIRWWCARRTCWAAARWRSSTSSADLERYMREAVKVSNDSPVLLDRFLNDAIEVDVDACATARTWSSAASWSTSSRRACTPAIRRARCRRIRCRRNPGRAAPRRRWRWRKALKVVGLMNVQFAIQDGVVYVLEVNPRARARCRSSRRRPACRSPRSRRAAWPASRSRTQGIDGESRPAVLLGEGSGVPVHQVPGRRYHPRARDEVDRRSDGRRRDLRRGVREVAARGGREAARHRARCSSASSDADKPQRVEMARMLVELGFELVATRGTAEALTPRACRRPS